MPLQLWPAPHPRLSKPATSHASCRLCKAWLSRVVGVVLLSLLPSVALAQTLQAPFGGAAIPLPDGKLGCGAATGGWSLGNDAKTLTPPADSAQTDPGRITVAASLSDCPRSVETLTLLAVGELPAVEADSVALAVSAGRLELRGKRLGGMRLRWSVAGAVKTDTCTEVRTEQGRELCVIPVGLGHSADPGQLRFSWAPKGGHFGTKVVTFDASGAVLSSEDLELVPSKVLLSALLEKTRSVDVSSGTGRLKVLHPEAIASVDCDGAQCELSGDTLLVRAVPASAARIVARMKLIPRVLLTKGEQRLETATREFDVVRCDLDLVSKRPVRDAEEVRVLTRLPFQCGSDPERLQWSVDGETVPVERVEVIDDAVYVLLRTSRLLRDQVTVQAVRPQDQSVLAVTSTPTVSFGAIHASLVLPGHGEVDFIPKNRDVLVATNSVPDGRLVPLRIEGAYEVSETPDGARVRGVYMSSGYTSLRLGYRVTGLPEAFATTNFAVLDDPIQRPLREANLPVVLGTTDSGQKPVVELLCAHADGKVRPIKPGEPAHIPFSQRDSCRLLLHRNRIPADSGEQLIEVEVGVTTAGDTERSDAKLSEKLLLRHGDATDVIWIRGAKQQFDRIGVRVHHVIEQASYLLAHGPSHRLPVAQWTVITEDATLKFYATATIPSGLFRFSDDPEDLGTGALAFNFGVLSRLTLLSDSGKESLVGLEGGVMSLGLASERDRQLALVGGFGVGVPLGNVNQPTQASLNIHVWLAYSLGNREATQADGEVVSLNPWALVFGPSITIGSIAAFL